MGKIEAKLKSAGYNVVNITYPSSKYSIEEISEKIFAPELSKLTTESINFVGFSMGNLIIRYLLEKHRPQNLGRVVMLAPPNNGSKVADFLIRNKIIKSIYKKIYGPAGQQLGTASANAIFAYPVNYELGIIAAKYDDKVSVSSTKLEGMKEHITIPATHTFIAQNQKAIKYVENFLKHGYF